MKNQDSFKIYFKEISAEKIVEDFTLQVMDRVSLEPQYNLNAYQPIISKKSWMKIIVIFVSILTGSFVFFYFLSGNAVNSSLSVYQFDASILVKPFRTLIQLLTKIPLTVLLAILPVSALLFLDQLYNLVSKKYLS